RDFFGDEDPVGRRFRLGSGDDFDIEFVGVVPDGKYTSLKEEDLPFAFIPYTQDSRLSDMTFYLRTPGSGTSIEDVRGAVRAIDPALPIFGVSPLTARVEESIFLDRAVAGLSAAFGMLASLLAAIGLYGVMSYAVTRRTREIGLRMALGAERAKVLGMVLKEVAALAAIGLLVGIPAGLGLGRLVSSQLFELSPWDPLTLVAATAISAGVAIVSGYLPARRASRLDPVRALRWE
ncbi:MAG: FtsX-like permease family protein, partial [Vicinamibacteria bacterium]